MIPAILLPEHYRQSWCVAGGYAAVPAMATDIDVWVYGISTDELDKARAELFAYWDVLNSDTSKPVFSRKQFEVVAGEETRMAEYYNRQKFTQIKRVAMVYGRGEPWRHLKPIHVMVTNAPSPGAILWGFDISSHAVAIDWSGRLWRSPVWTSPIEVPARTHTANELTEPRMKKICERYGHAYNSREAIVDKTTFGI